MEASFDKAALNYDETFTHSEIGKMQRNQVYKQLSKQLDSVKNIFEINCGTGQDALWLAKQNFNVIATDVSPKMIEVAKGKAASGNPNFVTTDIKNIATAFDGQKFDLVFSNFGGLNCLSKHEIEKFIWDVQNLLAENGKLVLVIMPKNTLWEQFYFLAKAQFSSIFRRKKELVFADVDGEKVPTYYYNPKDIVNLAVNDFTLVDQKPIGFFVPPSYLESFFKDKKGLLRFLNSLESGISNCSFLSKHADHYIITLQKR
ncbi:class I SAM-dependent methyltransferase [Flavobacterium wongokense]|uniref:class I SAM-dependent methyltransferase n=1 Tax=Flavobacterium wongokense TaxID=2910674 RepID=UPI001F1F4009|nr:class I SAM-dependent methyltransferase [Flavobacterium sp. WG47]MCF6131625.1 class I SAM-dependent methyltransferase [Flavobacterium sp. WG47]